MENTTLDGRSEILENPPSKEIGSMDSRGDHLLLSKNFAPRSVLTLKNTPTENLYCSDDTIRRMELENVKLREELELLRNEWKREITELKRENEKLKNELYVYKTE